VWSDVACPWCYVGRRNLQVALEDIDERERPEVTWRAYQLDPSIPIEGEEAATYDERRFGADLARIDTARQQLVVLGEEVGIEFRFERQRMRPNTLLVHRLLAAAQSHGEREALMDACFAAYFTSGVDIGDPRALREIVTAQVGAALADELIVAAIQDPAFVAQVAGDLETAQALGITGVPCFVADRRIAVPGAVPPPVLAQLIAEASMRVDTAIDTELDAEP
ncbi:MAG: DsbA family oxidoreductase, partial [Thermoleophilia bacterium]|nr:DsbA family oxidoreductase [Thermoleophilia bacterium]